MRRYISLLVLVCAVAIAACGVEGNGTAAQEVAGPGGVTVTAPVAGQLAVSWTADAAAFKYYVFQSTSGGPFAFVASVCLPGGECTSVPPTTYTAGGLTGGVEYCYVIESAYPDGTNSDPSNASCAIAVGASGDQTISGALTVSGSVRIGSDLAVNTDIGTPFRVSSGIVTIGGQLVMSGLSTYSGTTRLQAINISGPPSGNNNDYVLPTQPVIALGALSDSAAITGMVAVGDGHVVTFINSSSTTLRFTHEDNNSANGHRLHLPGAATVTLAPDQIVTFIYGTGGRGYWRVLSKNF